MTFIPFSQTRLTGAKQTGYLWLAAIAVLAGIGFGVFRLYFEAHWAAFDSWLNARTHTPQGDKAAQEIVFALIISTVGFIAALYYLRHYFLLRLAANAPINQLAEGFARVQGQARSGGTLFAAPLSGKPCVAFRLKFFAGRNDDTKALFFPADADLRLDDGTGQIAIDLDGCDWLEEEFPPFAERWTDYKKVNALIDSNQDLTRQAGFLLRNAGLREYVLAEGDAVSICGPVVWENGALRLHKISGKPFFLSLGTTQQLQNHMRNFGLFSVALGVGGVAFIVYCGHGIFF